VNPKTRIWKMDISKADGTYKKILKSAEGFVFPCSDKCLVISCCDIYCTLVFEYMNMIADSIYEMSADEVYVYRSTTPKVIKRKIQELYTHDKRLAFPETCRVSRDWK